MLVTKPTGLVVLIVSVLLGVVLSAESSSASDTRASTVTVHADRDFGQWEGWGCSLAWWAKVFGDREDIADLFFTDQTVEVYGETLPGLNLNIVRYNAGASSWSEFDGRHMVVSTGILPFRQIEGY